MTIKTDVIAVKDIAKANMTVDSASGAVVLAEGTFEKTLPEGLTVETYKAHNKHRDTYLAGVHMAVGELGLEASEANKNLDQVSLTTNILADTFTTKVKRTRVGRNPAKPGEEVTTHGASSSNYTVNGAANKGQLKQVRLSITDQYKALAEG